MRTGKLLLIAGTLLIAIAAGSCKRGLLDVFPSDSLSDETVFQDISTANRVLTNVYGSLPDGFSRRDQGPIGDGGNWSRGMTALAMAEDDAEGNNLASSTHGINMGIIPTTWAYAEDFWVGYYWVIRKANQFMERIDIVPGDAALKARMKAEAQFIRAFCYSELIKIYGGVPLMLKAGTPAEAVIPRNSYAECVTQIIKDCDEAANGLPSVMPPAELGRATKVAALALKARVLLYNASPLNNPTNDKQRWTDAANAAKAVMQFGPAPLGNNEYSLYPDYYKLFIDKAGNKEVIFARKFQNPSIHPPDGARNKWYMSVPGLNDGGWGGFCPTQNLVDAYEMKNGLAITAAGSGYDPQDPYTNRDSRLSKTVVHQGSIYKNGTFIEIWRGGNVNNESRLDSPKTGYGLMKLIDTSKHTNNGSADNDWVFLRFGEVLLNYAEAQNEAVGPDASVYEAVRLVRERAGQPALPAGLDQAAMRQRLINERRVELSFEEHRFFDVRRWKLGSTYFKGPVYKVQITKQPNGSLFYSYPLWETRDFKEFQNLLPIPQSEIDRNGLLDQNPEYPR
ncbi:MAG: RagB/SusD family nutrient uptake outer membrane protein [Candidatus Pseudobacter hemicellulosilyticus]|uniref:RagB/SusD family nutrient uptake outer membrane protein n=1 Tax=Candidatus Pseudobacter hemicellulosilyticus TaxID=3121375 RepID=A0AAJ5WSJ5_9BACT|nr:MAG: RagB/SusD family nutrient uptake outer membrane protein [Pseudobacter sp.]